MRARWRERENKSRTEMNRRRRTGWRVKLRTGKNVELNRYSLGRYHRGSTYIRDTQTRCGCRINQVQAWLRGTVTLTCLRYTYVYNLTGTIGISLVRNTNSYSKSTPMPIPPSRGKRPRPRPHSSIVIASFSNSYAMQSQCPLSSCRCPLSAVRYPLFTVHSLIYIRVLKRSYSAPRRGIRYRYRLR